jgi:hypothetical protein
MAKIINDIDVLPGTELNPAGLRRYRYTDDEGAEQVAKETLADALLAGKQPWLLEERSKEGLIDLINDMVGYMATLARDYRVVLVNRVTEKSLQVGDTTTDTKLKQDAAVHGHTVGKAKNNNNLEDRVRELERKMEKRS